MGRRRATEARTLHQVFLLLLGSLGWSGVWLLAQETEPAPPLVGGLLFCAIALGARGFAFPLTPRDHDAEVSLDSSIFIATAACLGARVAALGAGALLLLDGFVRRSDRSRSRGQRVLYAYYLAGLTAGLLALVGRYFHLTGDRRDVGVVLAVGATFLLFHYAVQSLQLRLAGESWDASLKRNLAGLGAEATLLPLASAMVLLWDPARPVPLILLGGTYLIVTFGFYRLARMAAGLRRRAEELAALNRIGGALDASLETAHLMPALLEELRRVLPGADRAEALVACNGAPERWVATDRGTSSAEVDEASRVLCRARELKREVLFGAPGARRTARSRMVAPLRVHGESLGVLVVETLGADRFGDHEVRLFEAIAGKAAAALENARLYSLANVDGLTGLYCRRYFDQRLAEEIERARRFGAGFSLLLLDLDDFKLINDTFGHPAGDRVLREAAAIAASQLRGVDLAARFGGEEFAYLLPRTSLADAHAVAERIREALATHSVVEGGRRVRLSASIGVAAFSEAGSDTLADLLGRADAALYRAKAAGKNRVEVDLTSFELTPSLAPVRRRRAV